MSPGALPQARSRGAETLPPPGPARPSRSGTSDPHPPLGLLRLASLALAGPAAFRAAVPARALVSLPSGPDRGSLRAQLPGATRRVLLWGGKLRGPRGVVRRASRNYSLTGFLSFIKTQSCGDVTSPAAPRPRSVLPAPQPRPLPTPPRKTPPTSRPRPQNFQSQLERG